MKYIDGQLFKKMVISGANNLYNNYPEVDALNVFPVPDGDTGMNMNLTMTSGSKEVGNRNDEDIYTIAKAFSRGLLMGARGNSGVILSQIFRGFADDLVDKKSIDAIGLSSAFTSGTKVAYKAVIKPVEGTILTVIREASERLTKTVTNSMSVEEAFDIILKEAKASLKRTPNLLPILKEVGVVDSGGSGLTYVLEGMDIVLKGSFVDRNEATAVGVTGQGEVANDSDTDEFGYCTEFIMRLVRGEEKKNFNKNRFTSVLNAHGNSLVVVQDDDIVKVHVHTLNPGNVLNYAQQFGEFVKLKIENMTEQHNQILFKEQSGEKTNMAAAKLHDAPLAAPKETSKSKEYGLIATSSGKGIDDLFKEIGVDMIVKGGQTMNPSTNDFLKAIEETKAKKVYIFPNNGNIIMAANQAKEILEGKTKVNVIPSKTIMQGVVAAMNFNPDIGDKENLEWMNESLSTVKSGAVTFAIKDTEIEGVKVYKDQYMAIKETKEILYCVPSKVEALKKLLENLVDGDSAILTLIYGEDVTKDELVEVEKFVKEEYKDLDVDVRNGEQPVYSFIVGVE
jgi:DAK2 domain fusion protein YloV